MKEYRKLDSYIKNYQGLFVYYRSSVNFRTCKEYKAFLYSMDTTGATFKVSRARLWS